jgi:REP element-mobilizing transposase RayT
MGDALPLQWMNMNTHNRHSIRLRGYDYTQPGAYFITLCTHQRECLLGEITEGVVQLSPMGQVVQACWQTIPHHFHTMEPDAFVIMPNHVHAIIRIVDPPIPCRGKASPTGSIGTMGPAGGALPLRGSTPGSLAAIIQNLKAVSSRQINRLRGIPGATIWQRNYYERIIRNERELSAVREYIANNPLQWSLDRENPARQGQS